MSYAARMIDPMTNRMEGTALARRLGESVRARAEELRRTTGALPTLAVVVVGDDPASHAYVRSTMKKCEQHGLGARRYDLPREAATERLLELLDRLAADAGVHGILLQHPLPASIDSRAAFDAIPVGKDVDGVNSTTLGRVWLGLPACAPCTAEGMMRLLAEYRVEVSGARAVVVGRSPIVGKPLAALLTNADATVTLCHSRTKDLPDLVRGAEIACVAVGKPRFVPGDWISPGAVVLDAGYHEGGVGDVDFDSAQSRARLITPVPGGVGPMTVAVLMEHVVQCADRRVGPPAK